LQLYDLVHKESKNMSVTSHPSVIKHVILSVFISMQVMFVHRAGSGTYGMG